ncbi:Pr6Pr family membrane protein [Pedobacter gandavensis]|uniref:Pr6Pr family membrane protein n=1 Tax=Pedobacter gandavensis TaxID=2679963 RepID=UPI002931660A|nr:Pr6Pr family membrane protein [Pedobacter gandavensis]
MITGNKGTTHKILLLTGCVSGWFALITQFYLIILNNDIPVIEAISRYFSYFTILTNIMVALCFTILFFDINKKENFFSLKSRTLTAVTLYIFVVGLVYNLILRFTWQPQGLQRIVDELLHLFIPVLFLIYWLVFDPKTGLKWSYAISWLIYPFAYLVFILVRGSFSGFYPYPFVDVLTLGYHKVMMNSFYLLILFLALSLLLIWIGKKLVKRDQH